MWLSSKKEGLSGSSYQVGLSRAIKTLENKSFIRLFDIFMCEVMWSISECDNPGNPVTLLYIHNTYTNCHLDTNTRKQEHFSWNIWLGTLLRIAHDIIPPDCLGPDLQRNWVGTARSPYYIIAPESLGPNLEGNWVGTVRSPWLNGRILLKSQNYYGICKNATRTRWNIFTR